jgi:hypothetical protein
MEKHWSNWTKLDHDANCQFLASWVVGWELPTALATLPRICIVLRKVEMNSFRPEELPISRDPGLLVDRVDDFPEEDLWTTSRLLAENH